MRDDAFRTSRFDRALARLPEIFPDPAPTELDSLVVELIRAQLLRASGAEASAQARIQRVSELLETETNPMVRGEVLFLLDLLEGRTGAALDRLASTGASPLHRSRAWYHLEREAGFDRLREEPRFQAALAAYRAERARERSLREQMRERGEVPRRPVLAAAPNAPAAK